jgi:cytohesin
VTGVQTCALPICADVNKATDNGWTPLLIAAHNGHEAVVRALIQAGADVNKATDTGMTPPYMAAQKGHTAIVQILGDAVLHEEPNENQPV